MEYLSTDKYRLLIRPERNSSTALMCAPVIPPGATVTHQAPWPLHSTLSATLNKLIRNYFFSFSFNYDRFINNT